MSKLAMSYRPRFMSQYVGLSSLLLLLSVILLSLVSSSESNFMPSKSYGISNRLNRMLMSSSDRPSGPIVGMLIKDPVQRVKEKPLSLVKILAKMYRIDLKDLIEELGGKYWITEQMAKEAPLTSMSRIIDKVFIDNECQLRFTCQIGSSIDYYKPHIPESLEQYAKENDLDILIALINGIRDSEKCATHYGDRCEPTLREPFLSWSKESFE